MKDEILAMLDESIEAIMEYSECDEECMNSLRQVFQSKLDVDY